MSLIAANRKDDSEVTAGDVIIHFKSEDTLLLSLKLEFYC